MTDTNPITADGLIDVAQTHDQIARRIRDGDVDDRYAFGYNYYRRIALTARSNARALLRGDEGGDDA